MLYLWNLSASGWANAFYSAAAQAGASNWTAMLFGSSDAANAITVDKTPAALWIIDVSVRLFGLNSWSVLVPQALEGVAAVALLYAAVRRVSGPGAALLAGAVFALTPVAALMFRFNNPDALLVLLLVAAAYCVQRACEKDSSRWWLIAAGVAVGFGFLAKMLQAFLVLPGFAVAYLVAAHRPAAAAGWSTCSAALAAVVVSGGWYLLLVELWPTSSRPYIGGSQHDSIVELALGYNGFGRLTGDEPGGLGNLNHDVGWGRLFGTGMGAGHRVAAARGGDLSGRGPDHHPARAANRPDPGGADLWGGWLADHRGGVQLHERHRAPVLHGRARSGDRRGDRHRRNAVVAATAPTSAPQRRWPGAVLVTTILAAVLLSRHGEWLPWLRAAVAVGGVGAAALLLVVGRLTRPVARVVAALAVVVSCLAAPAAYSIATAATPHSGAIPSVGPSRHGGAVAASPDPADCSTRRAPGRR